MRAHTMRRTKSQIAVNLRLTQIRLTYGPVSCSMGLVMNLPMYSPERASVLDADPLALLTTGNPKTAKGEGSGYLTAILHLAPHKVAGFNVCGYASQGCAAACLNTAGRGGIGLDADGLNTIQIARIRRTRYFKRDRSAFFLQLADEIAAHALAAHRHGLRPAVRLNGTSDLPWEKLSIGGFPNVFAMFPDVQFYDYTKWPIHKRRTAPNYHLTFSLCEDNETRAADALRAGVSVAAVFDTRKSGDLPATHTIGDVTARVIDADKTDLRFLDEPGVICGLRAKGRAKSDTSGFVRRG
jgi:hypothetical protein